MLKIQSKTVCLGQKLITPEGQFRRLVGGGIRRLCEPALTSNWQLVLDCAGVLFLDDQGVLLAQSLLKKAPYSSIARAMWPSGFTPSCKIAST